MVSIIKNLDNMSLQLIPSVAGFGQGVQERNLLAATESSFGTASGLTYLSYYLITVPNTLERISQIFKIHAAPAAAVVMAVSDRMPLPVMLFYLGVLASGLKFFKESLSLYRQQQFLAIFKKHAWQETKTRHTLKELIENLDKLTFRQSLPQAFLKEIETRGGKAYLERLFKQTTVDEANRLLSLWTGKEIRDVVEEIKNLPASSLERALPEWLFLDIIYNGGKEYFNTLLKNIYKGDRQATVEGTQLLERMQSFAAKKRILHILGMIAAVVGAISCIGFVVTFPFALTCVLLLLTLLVATSAYMVRKGYVENRDGGFSFSKLLPAFMQGSPDHLSQLTPQNLAYVPMQKYSHRGHSRSKDKLDRLRSFHFQSRKRPLQSIS